MKHYLACSILALLLSATQLANAAATKRIPEFSNAQTNVWKTIIYPTKHQSLKMHRHDYDRVIVALSNGKLKITNDQGKVHYMTLKKHQAYYLSKDSTGELHMDENVSKHAITVMVIELKTPHASIS
ncbi:MAG: hypothetical protein P1U32_08500 [Legionellaceae bacterium]|nr:hypothetical protein [Legionellaceae bacterium]